MPNDDTVNLLDLLALSTDARFGRIADTVERELPRLADAAERQADAMEALAGMFKSVIGATFATSAPNWNTPLVNYLRCSPDGAPFRSDKTEASDDEE
jgi:hypothetical protein